MKQKMINNITNKNDTQILYWTNDQVSTIKIGNLSKPSFKSTLKCTIPTILQIFSWRL